MLLHRPEVPMKAMLCMPGLRMKAGILFAVAVLLVFTGIVASQENQEPKQAASPISVAPWVLHTKLVHEVVPQYPKAARNNKVQGDIFIDVVVDETGNVQTARLANCMNCSSALGDAALAAVKEWKYQPTLVDGKPVQVSSFVVFRFLLLIKPSVAILTKSEKSTPANEALRGTGPGRLRISSGTAEANLIHKVEPEYPAQAKANHIQGDVLLQCVIDKEGNLIVINVLSGPPVLVEASVKTVRQWKYKPYTLNGEPVEVETTITIKYHM